MFVVVMGELDRDEDSDREAVNLLLDELKNTYSDLTIVSGACSHGIGSFVRERCIANRDNPEFGFVEFDIKVWHRLSEAKLAQVYMSRNPAVLEIGEVFHIFSLGKTIGHIPSLLSMVKKVGLPLCEHTVDGTRKTVNFNSSFHKGQSQQKQALSSKDLRRHLE